MTAPFFFAGLRVMGRGDSVAGRIEKSKVLPSGRVIMLIRFPSGDTALRDHTQVSAVVVNR